MDVIEILCKDRKLIRHPDSERTIITWNTGYMLNFVFQDDWPETKTLRVVDEKGNIIGGNDIIFTGNQVELPKVVNTSHIGIGIYAGDLISTPKLILACKKSILDDDGTPLPPTNDVYSQVMDVLDKKADAATSISGYGITDAYTKEEINNMFNDVSGLIINISSVLTTIQEETNETLNLQNDYIGGDGI